ncbi:killer cell lectin-like receptor subfamily A, member 1 [Sus scrofa]|uniref:Killer cell lectin-like receptor subfamily A, member 1 n=2 Tax=Sus scrofa TaxID=9823 RepID=A0A4X1UZU5_PIG|nr:killer cell lectin-like receptor subfamily A, member 1 [Sus scrofa]AAP13541.1 Ly49 [Sus scrofa]
MNDQEVTYSSLTFLPSPSESQNRLRPGGTQKPGKTDEKEFSVLWHRIAVILGILCFLLLVTVIVLGTKTFQYIQEKHQQEEILRNLTQKYHLMQNENYLNEQLLTNKTLEYSILYNQRKGCCRKMDVFSKPWQNTGHLNEGHLSCWRGNFYYFTTKNQDWSKCKETCKNYASSLLKIDDNDELIFLQSQIYQNFYWIGLSFNEMESKWKWIDNSTSYGLNLKIRNFSSGRGECAFLTSTRVTHISCSNTYSCICKKIIDFFN